MHGKIKFGKNLFIFLLCIVIMAIIYAAGEPVYESNDDMGIIAILTGELFGIAMPEGIFISPLLAGALYLCYGLIPEIPWFSLLLYLSLLVGLYLNYKIIIKITSPGYHHTLLLLFSLTALFFTIFLRLNFTSAALFLFFAVSLYIAFLNLSSRVFRYTEILLGVLLGLSYLIRPNIIMIGLFFVIPVLLTFLRPGTQKRLVFLLIPLVFIVLSSYTAGLLLRDKQEWNEYTMLQKPRLDFHDTIKSRYNENTAEALRKAGWSREEYQLARLWWSFDENTFSAEKMEKFLEYNTRQMNIPIFSLQYGLASIGNHGLYISILFAGLTLIRLFNSNLLYSKTYMSARPKHVFPVAVSVVYILAGIFVLMCIRFPHRIALPLFIYVVSRKLASESPCRFSAWRLLVFLQNSLTTSHCNNKRYLKIF